MGSLSFDLEDSSNTMALIPMGSPMALAILEPIVAHFQTGIPCLVFQNPGAKAAKLILNTLLIGVFHYLTSLRARRCGVVISSLSPQ